MKKTIDTYREGLDSFRKYLCNIKKIKLDKITFDIISADLIREYLKHLIDEGKALSTRNSRLTVIKQYLKYCTTRDIELIPLYQSIIPIKCKTVKPKKHNWITKNQVILILDQTCKNRIGIRDRFIMFFLFSTGVRLAELLNVKLKDVQTNAEYPYVRVIGKGNKPRIVPVTKEFTDNYKYYLKLYHPSQNPDNYVFYTQLKDQRYKMSEDNVQRIISKYGELARKKDPTIPKVHPHLFRHSFGALMYRSGLSLPEVAKLMGHEQLSTTEIYAETDVDMLEKALDKINNNKVENKWKSLSEDEKLKVLGLKK